MNIMKRSYNLKDRAESQARTRQKIIDATVALHQEKGLSATSVSDIAKRAKVGKVTVYRHFPDETALVTACSGEYFEMNPMPDPNSWLSIADAKERLIVGLREAYSFHSVTAPMMKRVLAEARDHPVMQPYHDHWQRAGEVLSTGLHSSTRGKKTLLATLALALSFDTWNLLVSEHCLSEDQAIDLMVGLIFKE